LKDTWAKIEARGKGGKVVARAGGPGPGLEPGSGPGPGSGLGPEGEAGVPQITIDEFARLDLRVGVVKQAEAGPEANKLIRLEVDVGEARPRQIFAGLRADYPDPSVLVGKRVIVVANLKPRQMKFGVSEGMVLAAGAHDHPHRVATFDEQADAPRP